MKKITTILLLISDITFGQVFVNDTTMSGTYNANGQAMYIYGKISGNVTLTNGIIIANSFQQIFDTTVIIGSGMQCEKFSGRWFGASPSLQDNSRQIQYAINASINKDWKLYLPSGNYKTSQSLAVVTGPYGSYEQSKLIMYGDAEYWGDGGTTITYSGDSCALGMQLNKGSEISHLIIKGGWVSPTYSDSLKCNYPIDSFTNKGTSGNGVGLWIDHIGNFNQRGGSTGCYVHDVQVKNFKTDIQVSNSISQNGDNLIFERIQLGDAKYGFVGSQPQEKGNILRDFYVWANIYTVFNITSGNYFITGANIVGPVQVFNIYSQSWFPVHISNIYAESVGKIGSLSSALPMGIYNSIFDFKYPASVGYLTVLTTYFNTPLFTNCQFRYYGDNSPMKISGAANFNNCLFSGTVQGAVGSNFTTYSAGQISNNGSMVVDTSIIIKDTLPQPPSVKISLRSSNKQQ